MAYTCGGMGGLGLGVAPAVAGEVTGAVHVANEALRQCANTIA